MKILFIACLLSVAVISCKKSSNTPSDAKTATGTLRYYPTFPDEDKLRFETDGPATYLIFSTGSYDYTFYQSYKQSFDQHATLIYEDTGGTGCSSGLQASPCTNPLPVVKVVKLTLDN